MTVKNGFILISISVALCACSKSVKDDWPGINDISIETEGVRSLSGQETFSLQSKISLPKMGEDVSYTIQSTCPRDITTGAAAGTQKTYSKKVSFTANSKLTSKVDIIDHVPSELLIYPEFFTTCTFELKAKNQNGSTRTSTLSGVEFVVDESRRTIEFNQLDFEKRMNSKDDLAVSFAKVETGYKIKQSKLLCFTDKLTTSSISDADIENINGAQFRLPTPTKNIPIEHCIIKGISTDSHASTEGDTILSNRFSILNGKINSTASITVQSTLAADLNKKPIPYDSTGSRMDFKLMTLMIGNFSDESIKFELEDLERTGSIHVINGLNKASVKSKGKYTSNYSVKLAKLPSKYSWTGPLLDDETKTVSLEPNSSTELSLWLHPKFKCLSPRYNNTIVENQEIGFITSLDKDHDVLRIKQTSENEFMKESIEEGNIFDLNNLNSQITSNLSFKAPGLPSSSSFKFFFRNNLSYSGLPLYFANVVTAGDVKASSAIYLSESLMDRYTPTNNSYRFENTATYGDTCTEIQ